MSIHYLRKEIDNSHINQFKHYYELSKREKEVYQQAVIDSLKYTKALNSLCTYQETQELYEIYHDFRELAKDFHNLILLRLLKI
jgi:siroheme synthase (precorrin-2 oxidase/ferrochelatase)